MRDTAAVEVPGAAAGIELQAIVYQGQAHLGVEKGIEKERRTMLRELLEERFGPLSPEVLRRVDELPAERLQPLRKAAWKAASLAELGLDE